MKYKHDFNSYMAWTFMFILFLGPALVSTSEERADVVYVVSPAETDVVADRIANDVPAENANEPLLGMGGPREGLLSPLEEPEVGSGEATPKARKILKTNQLNYANAIFPVEDITISSDFGWRSPPCAECSSDHGGVDFVPGYGAEIVAILDGLVVEAGVFGGYGTWVKLEHRVPSVENEGEFEIWETVYAHMVTGSIPAEVGVGSIVTKGQLIGLVGNTGTSTGDHLHFEIVVNGEQVDPIPLMATYTVILRFADGDERFLRYK